jgi:hypothetical protein
MKRADIPPFFICSQTPLCSRFGDHVYFEGYILNLPIHDIPMYY